MNRPTAISSAAQVRALDAWEIEKRQVPSYTLMTRAADLLQLRFAGTLRQLLRRRRNPDQQSYGSRGDRDHS